MISKCFRHMGVWGWQLACLQSVKELHDSQSELSDLCVFLGCESHAKTHAWLASSPSRKYHKISFSHQASVLSLSALAGS